MPYYQITYSRECGETDSDFLRKDRDIQAAREYAEHRLSAGYSHVAGVTRISKEKAQQMADDNCINWSDL